MIACLNRTIKSARGVTLVELLVTLSVTALLFVVLSQAVSFGVRVWERGDGRLALKSQSWSGDALLRQLVSVARQPISRNSDPGEGIYRFKGSRKSMSFVTGPLRYSARVGLVLARLEVSNSPEGQILLLHWSPISTSKDSGRKAGAGVKPVLGPADAIWFSFAGQNEDAPDIQWHPDWLGQESLPIAIKIVLRTKRQGSAGERELIIPTRLGRFLPLLDKGGEG